MFRSRKSFWEVEAQTDYSFMYSTETVQSIRKVGVNVTNVSIKRLMDAVFDRKALYIPD